jgi:hypothetical protein
VRPSTASRLRLSHDPAQSPGRYPCGWQDADAWLGIELLSARNPGDRIAEDLAMSSTWFFAASSAALVVSALVGASWPYRGRNRWTRSPRDLQRSTCGRTDDPRLGSFASDAVASLDGSRTGYGHWPIRHDLCGARSDLRVGGSFCHHGHYLAGWLHDHGRLAAHRLGS